MAILLVLLRLFNQQLLQATELLRIFVVWTISIEVDVILGGVDDYGGGFEGNLNAISVSLNSQDAVLLTLHFIPPTTLAPSAYPAFTHCKFGIINNRFTHIRLYEVAEESSLLHWNIFDYLVAFNFEIQVEIGSL